MTPPDALRRGLPLVLAFIAMSCQGLFPGCGPDPGTIPDPDDTDECGLTIDETWPADGATDFYYRADLEFWLDDPDPRRTPMASLDGPGGDVPGDSWLSEDEETVYFTPAAPLEPNEHYVASLATCMGTASIQFTTSALGLPLEIDLVGRTYLVNLLGGRVVTPKGFGDVIASLVGEPKVLVEVQQADDSLVLLGAVTEGHGPEQAPCSPTIPFPSADFTAAPYFEVPPMLLDLEVEGSAVSLHEFTMAGTFAADGSWLGGAVLGGELDTRDLVGLVGEIKEPPEVCELLASFGAECVACSSDGEILCLAVLIDRIEGVAVDVDVVEITDPESDPDCQ